MELEDPWSDARTSRVWDVNDFDEAYLGHFTVEAFATGVVLSVRQGNVAAPSRVVDDERITGSFEHPGHRTPSPSTPSRRAPIPGSAGAS